MPIRCASVSGKASFNSVRSSWSALRPRPAPPSGFAARACPAHVAAEDYWVAAMTPAPPADDSARRELLLLLDGHSLAYRAFFALPAENFATTTGQPTNA